MTKVKELQESIEDFNTNIEDITKCKAKSIYILISTAQDYAKLQLELEEVKMCYERGKHYDKR